MTASFFQVAINPLWPGQKLKQKSEGETRWGRHTGAWPTEEHSLESFAQRVCKDGFAFCAVLKTPWRKSGSEHTNWRESSGISMFVAQGGEPAEAAAPAQRCGMGPREQAKTTV